MEGMVSAWWWLLVDQLMPQSHPITGPVRFLSPVWFLACKAEWSARRNFTSVLFSWSQQATGRIRLHTTVVHLWFGRIICRTPRVPRAIPVWVSFGPRTGIFNVRGRMIFVQNSPGTAGRGSGVWCDWDIRHPQLIIGIMPGQKSVQSCHINQ